MPFIPHTEDEVREMLAAIGVDSIDDLFDEIPAALRSSGLKLVPPGMNEMDITRLMQERAEQDKSTLCFAGAGAYEHHIPAAVWEITTRGEFYSAYTPYQAEASQRAGFDHRSGNGWIIRPVRCAQSGAARHIDGTYRHSN